MLQILHNQVRPDYMCLCHGCTVTVVETFHHAKTKTAIHCRNNHKQPRFCDGCDCGLSCQMESSLYSIYATKELTNNVQKIMPIVTVVTKQALFIKGGSPKMVWSLQNFTNRILYAKKVIRFCCILMRKSEKHMLGITDNWSTLLVAYVNISLTIVGTVFTWKLKHFIFTKLNSEG